MYILKKDARKLHKNKIFEFNFYRRIAMALKESYIYVV